MDAERRQAAQAMFRYLQKAFAAALLAGLVCAFAFAKLVAGGAAISAEAKPALILYPLFVMFLLVAAVLSRMGWLRVGGVLAGTVDPDFYKTYDKGEEPEAFRLVTRHFINLFEMPVLFYVVVIVAFASRQVTFWLVGVAWAYVVMRLFHSYVHLTSNDVPTRLAGYASSGILLVVLWTSLFVGLLRTA